MKLALALLIPCALVAQRKTGSPLDHLPPEFEVLTHFGERADISPDNARVAFMSKSFGDAFVIDLKTREIRCLTCNVPAAVFLRVMHLATGDYILIGPDHFEDVHTSRSRDNELWFLAAAPGAKPVRLGEKMNEGAAISKGSMRIAYSQTRAQHPSFPRATRACSRPRWISPARRAWSTRRSSTRARATIASSRRRTSTTTTAA